MRINKFIKNCLSISFLAFLMVTIASCNSSNSSYSSNLPELVDDDETPPQEIIIHLEDLNNQSPDAVWKGFFTQRGADNFWNTLQKRRKNMLFELYKLMEPAEGISESNQANETVAGIIRYLSCFNVKVQELSIIGAKNYSNHRLKSLPAEIGTLTSLQALTLSDNQLTATPPEIGSLTNLRKLFLSGNRFTELPGALFNLTQLNSLAIDNNQISQLPDEISNLKRLEHLYIGNNQLEQLPAPIGALTELTILDVSNNKLKKTTNNLGSLTKLKELNLSHNELTEIPSKLEKLTSLDKLDLSYNELTEIPSELGKLIEKLTDKGQININLSYNQLKILPFSMFMCLFTDEYELNDISNNQWLTPESTSLKKINLKTKEEISKHAEQQSYVSSLQHLIIWRIQNSENKAQYNLSNLPDHINSIKKLQEIIKTEASLFKDIIFFENIHGELIPFYLDYGVIDNEEAFSKFIEFLNVDYYQILPTASK
jgi:Leucine-rich repeat (LRR) protein